MLRQYQADVKRDILEAWQTGANNVLAVLPTGAGKTVLFSDTIRGHDAAAIAIAHRQELIDQISLALAREKVRHRIVGPKDVVKMCVQSQMEELGTSYYDPDSQVAVAGVDTLIRREAALRDWLRKVTLWVQDEAHHVTKGNKWGKAASMFSNARGLGVTATPLRADGQGLGRHADGLFDVMVEGPGMRDLINMNYLTEYRIFAPPSDLNLSNVTVSATTGDYNPHKLKAAVKESRIVGDVVYHYLKIAVGKLGITFATDVETATDIAQKFNEAGVPAAAVSAKTPSAERKALIRKFRKRELLQLVNVDIFGEGFDLPAIEVVSMARPTESYGLFVQQFGRALRVMHGKKEGVIIDHAGNVMRHGLPDASRVWTLDRREKRAKNKDDVIPVTNCLKCLAVYERIYKACPYCGHTNPPASRSTPEFVDGDLLELDASVLATMRGEVEKVDMDPEEYRQELIRKGAPRIGQMAHVKRHMLRQEAQKELRESIALWAGYQRAAGRSDSESYRRYYFKFGIDVMSSKTLNEKATTELTERINEEIRKYV